MYKFDEVPSRLGTNSMKWSEEDVLPLWVADMDFPTSPSVTEAILHRAQHGVFGYTLVPDAWYDAYLSWWERRHAFKMKREWLQFTTGVVPAITSCVKRLTNEGDEVVLLTPVYDIFFHSVENTGRHVLEVPLTCKKGESSVQYSIDFAALRTALSRPLATLLILCNPHNPTGNVWTREELAEIGKLCKAYGVRVISDEIHCDLTLPGVSYTPFASVDSTCASLSVTCISPSKAFNLAGLQGAAVCVPNETLRNIVVRGLNSDEVAEPNCFAAQAAIAAFQEGEEWLDALRTYLAHNREIACSCLSKTAPLLRPSVSQATYLLWIDCISVCGEEASSLWKLLYEREKLRLSDGSEYRGDGKGFLRLNLACPRSAVEEGVKRLCHGVETWLASPKV